MRFGRALIPLLIGASLISIFAACLLGTTPMSFGHVISAIFGRGEAGDSLVIWHIRLPRALAAFCVGAALGASGAALQGLLRNPLAEPGILGVSASASLAATFVIYYGIAAISPWAMPIAAIIGALIATIIIALAAIKTRSVVTLILIGVGLSSFAGAAMSLLLNFAPTPFFLADMINWTIFNARPRHSVFHAARFISPNTRRRGRERAWRKLTAAAHLDRAWRRFGHRRIRRPCRRNWFCRHRRAACRAALCPP